MNMIPVSSVLLDALPGLRENNALGVYRAKMVSVRRMQAQGLADDVIERAFGIALEPADRKVLTLGSEDSLLIRVRWHAPARRGRAAAAVAGDLEVVVRGHVLVGGAATGSFLPEEWLGFLVDNWSRLLLDPVAGEWDDGPAFCWPSSDTLRIGRVGNLVRLECAGQGSDVAFNAAVAVLESFGNCLCERLRSDDFTHERAASWLNREDVEPQQALSAAVGKVSLVVREYLRAWFDRMGRAFDFGSLASNPSEVCCATRMAGHSLADDDIIGLIDGMTALPLTVPKPELAAITEEAADFMRQSAVFQNESSKPFQEGQALARWLRERLNIGDESSVDPEALLEGWGVALVRKTLCRELDAIAVWGKNHGPAIVLNPNGRHAGTTGGQRASLCHEIGHVLMDRCGARPLVDVIVGKTPGARSVRAEVRARAFAAEFLVPQHVARRQIGDYPPDIASRHALLCKCYGVTSSVAAWQTLRSAICLSPNDRHWLERQTEGH